MKKVSDFISAPSPAMDLKVAQVFTDVMFDQLAEKMTAVGWTGIDNGTDLIIQSLPYIY